MVWCYLTPYKALESHHVPKLHVERPHGPISFHIGMIYSTLGLNPHDFVFVFFLLKASYQLNVIHACIFISFFISNRYETFVKLGVLNLNKVLSSLSSNKDFFHCIGTHVLRVCLCTRK